MIQNKVLVLMSTYNGEKYLQEQLDSLVNQKDVELRILIRDDGSKDNTIEILKQFKNENANVDLILGSNIGCKQSFMELVNYANEIGNRFDFFCFCDQDDIWLDNKLTSAISKLNKFQQNVPSLYCSHVQMVNHSLSSISSKKRNLKNSFGESIITNAAVGCTVVFNTALLDIASKFKPDYISMHDSWFYRLCLAMNGNIYYDSDSYILYRQHDNNVIGGNTGFVTRWKRRLKRYRSKEKNSRQNVAISLMEGFQNSISDENKIVLNLAINYKNSLRSKTRLMFCKEFKTNSFEHNLMFKISVLLGVF